MEKSKIKTVFITAILQTRIIYIGDIIKEKTTKSLERRKLWKIILIN